MQKFAFVFPGQGSQKLGMLADLAEHYPVIVDTFREASSVIDLDLWDICQHDGSNMLDTTEVTQPLLLTASVAIWRLWQSEGGPTPLIMAGHSLGEYSALTCAGVIEFADAVNLVHKRGRYMQSTVPAGTGAMAAIVGLDGESINTICATVAHGEIVSAANYNSPGQIVIAGSASAVQRAMIACKDAGAKRALPLKVSVPSHCELMRPASEKLADDLKSITFNEATIPVVQNVNARITTDPQTIKNNLLEQLYRPVLWIDCIQFMRQGGVSKVIECGPGMVLCGLIKRIDKELATFGCEDNQSFSQAKEEVSV
ncbi:MAG: ACP S-malonyltransferase [Pseudohongiellaceae bacterium]